MVYSDLPILLSAVMSWLVRERVMSSIVTRFFSTQSWTEPSLSFTATLGVLRLTVTSEGGREGGRKRGKEGGKEGGREGGTY